MSPIWFLLFALVLSVVGGGIVVAVTNRPRSLHRDVSDFAREMAALAPSSGERRPRRRLRRR